jgi:large subunit ribosomal protein L5
MLYTDFQQNLRKDLQKKLGLKNPLAVPYLKKVVINQRVSEARENKEALDEAIVELSAITGQKPIICSSKKAEAGFKIRKGDPLALKVTLRHQKMYDFIEKLFKLVLPTLRDFKGLSSSSFDSAGNYNFSLEEQTVFSEVDLDKVKKVRPLQITMVTSTNDKKHSKMLLSSLGLPFQKK